MSQGRLEVGLGAGWYEAEHVAYGLPVPRPGAALRPARGPAGDTAWSMDHRGPAGVFEREGLTCTRPDASRLVPAGPAPPSTDRDRRTRRPAEQPAGRHLRRRVQHLVRDCQTPCATAHDSVRKACEAPATGPGVGGLFHRPGHLLRVQRKRDIPASVGHRPGRRRVAPKRAHRDTGRGSRQNLGLHRGRAPSGFTSRSSTSPTWTTSVCWPRRSRLHSWRGRAPSPVRAGCATRPDLARPYLQPSGLGGPPVRVCLHPYLGKAGSLESGGQTAGIDGVVGVTLVVSLEFIAGQAVAGHKGAPGRRTRATSANRRSWRPAVGTWCSMVNDAAPLKRPSAKSRAVAFPLTMTTDRLPANRSVSMAARSSSISTAVRFGTDSARTSVVAPYPGPTSRTSSPRLMSPRAQGRIESRTNPRHSSRPHWRWVFVHWLAVYDDARRHPCCPRGRDGTVLDRLVAEARLRVCQRLPHGVT